MPGDNDKELKEQQPATPPEMEKKPDGHLGVLRVGDQDLKILNVATVMEIQVFKLEGGKEVSKLVAHEFMMTDHKTYMVRLLTDAIMMVMRAKKRQNLIKLMGEATFNKLARSSRLKKFLRRK